MMIRLFCICLFLISPSAVTVSAAPTDATAITAAFSHRDNEEGLAFLPINMVIIEGSFSGPSMHEAVVSFSDANQSHAAGIAEIWLLRLAGDTWLPILKVAENDIADFSVTDLNGDGVSEVLTHTAGGNQGFLVINRDLLSLAGGVVSQILTFEGFDNTGWPENGICAFDARFDFVDVNRDKVLEIKLTEYFDYCKKDGGESVFLRRSEKTTVFRPIISSSGSIIGIERFK